MKVINKKFVLLVMLSVIFLMCVGCTSPDFTECNLSMDKNGKGTYEVKYTFDKKKFEQSKYGKHSSMDEYVSVVENLVNKDLGLKFSTDTKSSPNDSYVTVAIDFESMDDFNSKMKAIFDENARLFKTMNKNEIFAHKENEMVLKAVFSDEFEKAFQKYLDDNGMEYDVNSDQYKLLLYVVRTDDRVITTIDNIEKKEKQLFASYMNKNTGVDISCDIDACKLIDNKLEVNPGIVSVIEAYIEKIVMLNKDYFFDNDKFQADGQQYMNQIVVKKLIECCEKENIVSIIKKASSEDIINLSMISYETLSKVLNDEMDLSVGYKEVWVYDIYKFESMLMEDPQYESHYNMKFRLQYGDMVINDVEGFHNGSDIITVNISDSDKDNQKNVEADIDDTPKTGDKLPLLVIEILACLALVALVGSGIYKFRRQ